MRVRICGCFLFFLSFFGIVAPTKPAKVKPAKKIRTISVCVLIDEKSLVPMKIVNQLIYDAASDYRKNVGIEFTIVESHNTKLDPLLSWHLSSSLRSECNQGQVVAVFTNQKRFMKMWGLGLRILGDSDKDFGVIWLYDVESRLNQNDCNLNPRITVEHEIAHLFGATHDSPEGSFMRDSPKCTNPWPRLFRQLILKNKYRTWNPSY